MIIPYIDYKGLNEFYTVAEMTQLFQISRSALKEKCEQYGILPRRNEIGEWGFDKHNVRKLHNKLYFENRNGHEAKRIEDDPWA